ncbi:MAG: ABC transporter ATP-binding protein [Alphaproteobacteria bacterium]|nr:ABC transporter ATP-binding protein [Alphaproteobacteria bacterium]
MALLEVKNLGVNFALPYRTLAAVKGASFALDKGETLALVGESGSGKTVTALSILQLLPAASASHPAGSSIRFDGAELVGAPESELRHIRGGRIAMIFQEPMTSLNPLHTVVKQIGEALWLHKRMSGKTARDRTIELLRLVGLPDAESRLQSYPHQLSGGQRQRVMIAMALANEPDLLIADEPTTALDVTVQAQILKLLKDLQARFGMALLLITHDLGVVRKMAGRVCVMTQGEIVEAGAAREVFDRPRHPYTRHLLDAQPKGAPVVPADGTPVLMDGKAVKVWFPIKTGLFRRTTGFIKAVDGIDLAVRAGETLGVVGESGSGKTTLGLALLRLVESQGAIVYDGKHLDRLSGRAMRPLRRELQIVFQDPYSSLSPRLTIGQIVEEGLKVHSLGGDAAGRRRLVEDALDAVALPRDVVDRYPHEFSGGMRQRLAFARILALRPRLIVLDEPTSALDMSLQAQMVDLLRDLQRRYNIAYLFISHDLRVVKALAHQILVMKDGKAVEQGPARQIFESPRQAYTRALMAAAFELETVDGAAAT